MHPHSHPRPAPAARTAFFLSTVLLLAAIVVPAGTATAQVRIGILGGGNFATLDDITAGQSAINFDQATGYHIGAFVDVGVGMIGVRPAVYYLDAGPLFEGASFLSRDDFNLVYVTVPVDLRLSLGAGPVQPYVLAGPELRILASAGEAPQQLEDELKALVVNAGVAVGVAIRVPGFGVTLYPQIRYSFGLSDVLDRSYEIEGISVTTDGPQRPNMWLLSLGIGL